MITNQNYYSQTLIVECMKSKLKMSFDFSNYSTKSKYYDSLNELVTRKMKDESGGVPIEEFVGLKPKMYSFLVDDNSLNKKAKGVKCCCNNICVATISHNKYKDLLMNNKCLRNT